jgi:hypothetical protein
MCSEKRPDWKFHHRQGGCCRAPHPRVAPRARVCRVSRSAPRCARTHTQTAQQPLASPRRATRGAGSTGSWRGSSLPCVCVCGRAVQQRKSKKQKQRQTAQALQCCHAPPRGLQQRCRKHRGERVSSRPAARGGAMQAAARAQRPRGSCQRVSAEQVQETPSAWAGAVIARRASAVVHRACVRARVQQRIEGTGEGSWAAICRAGSRAGGCRKAPIAAGCLHRQTQNMGERGARIRTCMRQRRQAERTPQTATVLRPFAKPAPPRRPTDCPRERGPDRGTTLDACRQPADMHPRAGKPPAPAARGWRGRARDVAEKVRAC